MLATLEDPNVPVRAELVQNGVSLSIRLERYRLDVRQGQAELFGLSVRQAGEPLVGLRTAKATGLNVLWGEDQVARVQVDGLALRLVREREGRFRVQRLFGPERGEPGKIPFEVALTNATVEYVDEGAGTLRLLTARGVRAAGIGDDWTAAATVRATGVGTLRLRLQNLRDRRLIVDAGGRDLQLGGLLNGELRRELPREMGLRTARADLRATALIPEGGAALFRAGVRAEGVGLRWNEERVERLRVAGVTSERGFAGTASAVRPGLRAEGEGLVAWTDGVRADARAVASVSSPASLPRAARERIPQGLTLRGLAYVGPVRLAVPPKGEPRIWTAGNLTGDEVGYRGERLAGVALRLATNGRATSLSLPSVRIAGGSVGGWAVLADNQLRGALAARGIRPERLPAAFRPDGVQGEFTGGALIGGSPSRPVALVRALGEPVIRGRSVGQVRVAATVSAAGAREVRAALTGPYGTVALLPAGGARVRVAARSVDVARLPLPGLPPDLAGIVSAEGFAVLDARAPRFEGRVEALGLRYGEEDVPVAAANVEADVRGARVAGLVALRGATVARGSGSVVWRSGRLTGRGEVDNLQASDLDETSLAGTLDLRAVRLAGTLARPRVELEAVGEELVAQGVRVDDLRAPVVFDGQFLRVADGRANVLGGTVRTTARYDPRRRQGAAWLRFEGVELAEVGSDLTGETTYAGTVGGRATVTLSGGRATLGQGQVDVDGLQVNGVNLGAGQIEARYDGQEITGSGSVGTLERYLALTNARYDPRARTLSGQIEGSRLPFEELATLAGPALARLPYDQERRIRDARGLLSFGVELSGDVRDPDLDLSVLEASGVRVDGIEWGTLRLAGARRGDEVTIREARLDGPAALASLSGRVVRGGEIAVDGEVSRLELSALAPLQPGLAGLSGQVSVPFVLSGLAEQPTVAASLSTVGLALRPGEDPNRALSVSLDQIALTPAMGLEASGVWRFRGFEGAITASAPFRYPAEIPPDGPVSAEITLNERPLRTIAELTGVFDADRTEGSVAGRVTVGGTPQTLGFGGDVQLIAQRLGLKSTEVDLRDVTAALNLGPQGADLTAQANNADGGRIEAGVTIPLGSLSRVLELAQAGDVRRLLETPVEGRVAAQGLRQRVRFADGSTLGGGVDGALALSGTLASPLIQGELTLSRVNGAVPAIAPPAGRGEAPPVDPRFDIRVVVDDPARIRAGTADLQLTGEAKLLGRLTRPEADAEFQVERGSIRLPGGLVRLQQGGTALFTLEGGDPTLLLDVEGRTGLTAQGPSGQIERYDVQLRITGDLLREGGLAYSATSDPPGLSETQVVALLARTDLISSLADPNARRNSAELLRNAVAGVAVPVVFEALTGSLAQGFGLDYLSLDYDPFDRATLVAARTLGGGFSVQGRRQLAPNGPGQPLRYDYRLLYRPRRTLGLLSRFSFSFGADQDRPYKFAIEYGTRFGPSPPPGDAPKRIIFSDRD